MGQYMAVSRDVYRLGLRALDGCLSYLEEAHERDEVVVSDDLTSRVGAHVPVIVSGMLIADAIELVFQEQERLRALASNSSGVRALATTPAGRVAVDSVSTTGDDWPLPAAGEPAADEPISVVNARGLTEQIRNATRVACLLLLQAYEQRVWFALGYRSWEEYVRTELGFRRSRAYEFLDQARVIRALQAAAHTSAVPDISAYMAEQIKPYLDRVVATVRSRTLGKPNDRAAEIIVEVVRQQRLVAISPNGAQANGANGDSPSHIGVVRGVQDGALALAQSEDSAALRVHLPQLFDVINYLAELPPIDDLVLGVMGRDDISMDELDRAVQWLGEFEARCQEWWQGCEPPSRTLDGHVSSAS
jgi:hypothetical protein